MLTVDGVKGRVEAAGGADPVAVCLRPPQAARQRLHALLPRRHQAGFTGNAGLGLIIDYRISYSFIYLFFEEYTVL